MTGSSLVAADVCVPASLVPCLASTYSMDVMTMNQVIRQRPETTVHCALLGCLEFESDGGARLGVLDGR